MQSGWTEKGTWSDEAKQLQTRFSSFVNALNKLNIKVEKSAQQGIYVQPVRNSLQELIAFESRYTDSSTFPVLNKNLISNNSSDRREILEQITNYRTLINDVLGALLNPLKSLTKIFNTFSQHLTAFEAELQTIGQTIAIETLQKQTQIILNFRNQHSDNDIFSPTIILDDIVKIKDFKEQIISRQETLQTLAEQLTLKESLAKDFTPFIRTLDSFNMELQEASHSINVKVFKEQIQSITIFQNEHYKNEVFVFEVDATSVNTYQDEFANIQTTLVALIEQLQNKQKLAAEFNRFVKELQDFNIRVLDASKDIDTQTILNQIQVLESFKEQNSEKGIFCPTIDFSNKGQIITLQQEIANFHQQLLNDLPTDLRKLENAKREAEEQVRRNQFEATLKIITDNHQDQLSIKKELKKEYDNLIAIHRDASREITPNLLQRVEILQADVEIEPSPITSSDDDSLEETGVLIIDGTEVDEDQLIAFIQGELPDNAQTDYTKPLNKLLARQGKATANHIVNDRNVLHYSAGAVGKAGGCSLFYIVYDNNDVELVGIGAHTDKNEKGKPITVGYYLYWTNHLPTYITLKK
ncbi:MAG: hypothetical protein ACRBFS_02240 [Aureispira sp.]